MRRFSVLCGCGKGEVFEKETRKSFTAKVKKTGQVFNATNEWEADGVFGRDAHEPLDGKVYGGHLFHTHQLTESPDVIDLVFSGIEWATFKAGGTAGVCRESHKTPFSPYLTSSH